MSPPGTDERGASEGGSAAEPARARIVLDLGARAEGWLQPLADLELWCDRPLLPGARPAPRPEHDPPPPITDAGDLIYDGPGIVAGGEERVRAWIDAAGFRTVEFTDGERFRVSPGGDRIDALGTGARSESAAADARRLELGLGAPLALALALHDVLLLHASALELGGRVAAFAAESGAGKSTLAAAGTRRPGWRRAADDILPVRFGPRPMALPAFPQLKLPAREGWPGGAPSGLELDGVYELEHRPGRPGIELERLSGVAAAAVLIRATLATRMFDESLLRRHFERVTEAVGRLPVWRLVFPSGEAGLEAVLDRIGKELGTGSGSRLFS